MELFQKGFHYAQDGPGNRLVYHLTGCNMRCPWCCNPECVYPGGTRTVAETKRLVEEAVSCRPMFFDGGGVTFTGGEATTQFDALKDALCALRARGINTALETNASSLRLPELFPLLDHLIADCKHPDDECHTRVTGVSNKTVLRNLALAAGKTDLLIRIPLIGGFNADQDALRGFTTFFLSLPADAFRVEVLPYHEYGRCKWEKVGVPYAMHDAFVPEKTRLLFEETFRAAGIRTVRT